MSRPTYLNPQTLDDLREIAKIILRSMPSGTHLETCMHAMAIVADYGFSVWRTAELVQVIGGKPGPNAKFARAIVLRSNPKIETLCDTPERVTIRVTRGENSHTADWTIARATSAGYAGKNANYKTVPQSMLAGRCWTEIASRLYADVGGSQDEADDMPPTEADVAAATAEAAATAPPQTEPQGRFQRQHSAPPPALPAPAPEPINYRERLKPHTALLRLDALSAEDRRGLGAELLAAATPELLAELDDAGTSDDTRRALLCATMGATPEQASVMLPVVAADKALLAMIADCLDGFCVVTEETHNYIAALSQAQATALWSALETDQYTAAGAIPGVTTKPRKAAKQKGE